MNIETKLNLQDDIFFLHEQKVIKSTIQKIKIECYGVDGIDITYLCNNEKDKAVNLKVESQYAFKTKEALLKSL